MVSAKPNHPQAHDKSYVDPHFGELSNDSVGKGVIGAVPKGDGVLAASLQAGGLPAGGPFATDGPGTWRVLPGSTPQVGTGAMTVFTYTVEVENGVDTLGFGGDDALARMVEATLADPKGWTNDKRFAFRRIDSGQPSVRISLASQMTTRTLCGFEIPIDSNCYQSDQRRVVLEEARWVRGAIPFQGDVGSYRQYQINHEVGHAIGYLSHQPCDVEGGLAPIMMQQTFGTSNAEIARLDPHGVVPADGKTCRYNPWPYPRG